MRIPFSSRNGRDGDLRDGVWVVDWVWLILQWLHGAWCIKNGWLVLFLYDSIFTSMAFLRVAFYLAFFFSRTESLLALVLGWSWMDGIHLWLRFAFFKILFLYTYTS